MVTVEADLDGVEARLAAGELWCPSCSSGVLAGWGRARPRQVRGPDGPVQLCPRRSRCTGCGVTHVLLPVSALLRRADTAAVIVSALAAKARCGFGFRRIAADLGRPGETVRGWLRRFAERAEAVRSMFTVWLRAVDPDPVMPEAAGGVFADAVTVIGCGRDRDRAPVRAAHGVAGRDGGGGVGWAVVGAGLAGSAGATRVDPAADADQAVNPVRCRVFQGQQRRRPVAVGDDEAKVRAERARAIGLFRYQLIREAADPAHSTKERGKMVRELASREHIDPFGRRVRISTADHRSLDPGLAGGRVRRAGAQPAPVHPAHPGRGAGAGGGAAAGESGAHRGGDPPDLARPSWAGRPMSAPCSATSTGWGSPAPPAGRRRRCSAGSRPSTRTTFGLEMRYTAYELRPARRTCSRFWTIIPGCCRATAGATPRTPCAWPLRCARRWPPAACPRPHMSITARPMWIRGCCGRARNSVCALFIPHQAGPKVGAKSRGSSGPCVSSSWSRSPAIPTSSAATT